jgi:glycosyltransferase involved in cell wall biosynthesis
MMPRVSVLMTIYNPGQYLRPAVDSMLAQTLTDFELVAVENGSSDGAKEIMRAYASSDSRVRFIDLPSNIGRTPALNLALERAQGDYIAVLDADDVAAPERLAREVEVLDAQPEIVLVASHVRCIDETGKVIGGYTPPTDPVRLRDALAYSNPFCHSACMFRRDAALAVGGYPGCFAFAQDFALWVALAQRGELAMIDQPLVDIREHGSRATLSPVFAFTRFREGLRLYRSSCRLPGLSAEAYRLGRANLATLHYVFAGELMKAHRPLRAMVELARSILVAPGFCLERAIARFSRGMATNRSTPAV